MNSPAFHRPVLSRPELNWDVRITDTTLRDGSHAMAHRFTPEQVRDTVRALDGQSYARYKSLRGSWEVGGAAV